jgi:16S rRNA processing protein RimM
VEGIGPRPNELVIARVTRARGIRGEVACVIETDFPDRFASMEGVTLAAPDGSRSVFQIEDCWFHKDRVILKFKGVDSRNDAEQLVGRWLVIPESEARCLEQGSFYEHQIVGAQAVTPQGLTIGRVSRVLITGGTDVLVVESDSKQEHLIPFADDICSEVDVAARRITVNAPEGLLDLDK